MKILVYDVAAENGGAVTVLQSFYEEFCKDTENEYLFVLSVCELAEQPHIQVLNFPWVKKSPLHRLFFDHFTAPGLVKKYNIDEVLSLQNIELPHAGVPQTVYEHNALPFSEHQFRLPADPGPDDEALHPPCEKSHGADQLDERRNYPSVQDSGRAD